MRICSAGALVTALIATDAAATGVVVGPLCLDGVAGTEKVAERTVTSTGTWTPTDFRMAGPGTPRLAVFAAPIPESQNLESCVQTEARMAAQGIQPILAGRPTALKLRALVFEGTGGNRVQIDKGALEATLASVDKGAHAVAGGTLSFKGSKLWITTSTTMLSRAGGIEGAMSIESWNRVIEGAQITLPGGLAYRADLKPRNEGNMTVEVDLQSGGGTLTEGDLIGTPSQVATANVALDVLELGGASLPAATVRVSATNGAAQVTLSKLRGTASALRIPGSKLNWAGASTQAQIQTLQGPLAQAASGFTLGAATLRSAEFTTNELKALTSSGQSLAAGAADLRAQVLSSRQIELKCTWTAPQTTALSPIFPNGNVPVFALSESGLQSAPTGSMQLIASRMAVGGLDLVRSTNFATAAAPLDAEISFPLDLSLGPASGSVELHDGEKKILLQGRLDGLELHGRIVVPLADLDKTRLEVPAGKFELRIGAAVSVSPFLAGTRPNFGSANVGARSFTDLVVSKASTGKLLLTAGVLALGQPVFSLGEEASKSPASITLTSDGSVKLLYGLDDSKIALVQARFHAQDVAFTLLGPEPHLLDLNGNLLSEPSAQFRDMLIEIDELGPLAVQRGTITELKVSAASVEHRPKPGETSGLAYAGTVSQPFSIEKISAARVHVKDAVKLEELSLENLNFGFSSALFDFGGGSTFSDASVGISAERIARVSGQTDSENYYTNASLAVKGKLRPNGQDFSVNNGIGTSVHVKVSGPEKSLTGTGSIDIGAFSGNARSRMEIGFKCNDAPKLKVPVEYNFGMTGASFAAKMTDGDLSAEGAMGPLALDLHTVGSSGCNSPSDKKVVVESQHGWTDGVCTQLFPPKAWHCKWEWSTPEVSFAYHIRLDVTAFNAAVAMTNPRFFFKKGNVAVCNVGAVGLGATAFVGGYSPQIETPFGGDGEKLVNAIIAASFAVPQSLFATSVLNGAGWLVTGLATAEGNLLCIGRV